METIIHLNYNDNIAKAEKDEKTKFLRYLLDRMNVPVDDFWMDEVDLSTDQKIKLRTILATYKITVIDNDRLQVFVDNNLVGSFEKPTCIIKIVGNIPIIEMTTNFWNPFEENQ